MKNNFIKNYKGGSFPLGRLEGACKILVIQQKMIGDVLTSTVLFERLREKFPNAELHYLVNSHTVPVLENNPFIDKLVLFTPELEKNKLAYFHFLKNIRKENYDIVIDVYGKLSSLMITWFSKAKIRISYYKKHTSFFYTATVKRLQTPENDAGLAIENRMKLLEPLGIPFQYNSPKIKLLSEEIIDGKNFLEKNGIKTRHPIFMIGVLGSSETKTYPPEYMAKIIDQIVTREPQAQILFNYIPFQRKEAKQIFDLCEKTTRSNIYFEVFGDSLRNFMKITYHCSALIGNEGGAVNMAKALGVPTFIIFCPYINKRNWFGKLETPKNQAVHLSDFLELNENDIKDAKEAPEKFYRKLKPELIYPKLQLFLNDLTQQN